MSWKRKPTREKGGAAATLSCNHTTVPLPSGLREESNALTWGVEAASTSSKSSSSPSVGVQSPGTLAPPQASRPEGSPVLLPPSPPSGPYTMSGIRAGTELGADITPSSRYLPLPLRPSLLPPCRNQPKRVRKGEGSAAPWLPLIGRGDSHSEESTNFIHSSLSQTGAGSGC